MSRKILPPIGILIIIGFILSACSGSGNPVTPGQDNILQESGTAASNPAQTHLWGFWTVTIDPVTSQVDILPLRNAEFTANVVNFLNGKTGSMGFVINEIITTTDYIDIDIDVTLTHPFAGLPQYHGYDVRGVFMGDGSGTLAAWDLLTYGVTGTDQTMLPDPDDGFGGPDGYTRWFNKPEFSMGGMPLFQYTHGKVASPSYNPSATLNPYKYFADGLDTAEDLWSWLNDHPDLHGVFSSGASNTRNYYLRFPSDKGIKFAYAVVSNWDGPDNHPSNAPESVALSVTDNSTIWYVDPANNGGNLTVDLSVWNWGAQLLDDKMDEYGIYLISPVLSVPYTADDTDMTPTGGDENFSTYHFEIPADNVTGTEDQELWIFVDEQYFDYTNDFGVPNNADTDPLTAVFHHTLSVSNESPECLIPVPYEIDPDGHPSSSPVDCTIKTTNLYGTTGLAVWLDMDGELDGTYDIPGTGIANIDVPAGSLDATFDITDAEPGSYYVVLTNSCGETGVSETPLFTVVEYLEGDYYVCNHADFDGEPELGTMEYPFHTISAALVAATDDGIDLDLILVDYGTGIYPELLYNNVGYFNIRAYNWYSSSGRPAIGGLDVVITDWQNYGTITFGNCNDITLQGFKLLFVSKSTGGNYHDIYNQYGGSNVLIKDCWFTGDTPEGASYCAAVTIYYVDGTHIENCLFKGINMPHPVADTSGVRIYAIDFQVQTNIYIERNEFTQFQWAGPSDGLDISLHTGYEGGTHGNFLVSHNLYHHIWPTTTDAHGLSFVGENYWDYYDDYEDPDWPFEVSFNTFDNINGNVAVSSDAIGIINYGYDNPYLTEHSNILTNFANGYSTGITDYYGPNANYNNLWNGPVWGSGQGVGNISADPLYVNNTTAPYDYQLQSGSPCIGTGQDGEDMGCYGALDSNEVIGLLTPE